MTYRYQSFLAAVLLCVFARQAPAQLLVSSAAELCAPTADPCVINSPVGIAAGAVLDLGKRTLLVSTGGSLEFSAGIASVACGEFRLETPGAVAFKARGVSGIGAQVTVSARRSCSLASALSCFVDSECQSQGAGACTLGSGNIFIGGRVAGNATTPADLTFAAAGDVTISEQVNLNGNTTASDGGLLVIMAAGKVDVLDRIQASGGADGSGGELVIDAASSVNLLALVDVKGGDFDGGFINVNSGGDINITASLLASSSAREGFGGDITLSASGDISVAGGSATSPIVLDTDGHGSVAIGGDGGNQDLSAGGNIYVGPFVKLTASGAAPDGFGDFITLDALGSLMVDGDLVARGRGSQSGGGIVDLLAGGDLVLGSTSRIDVGGNGGGGDLQAWAGMDVRLAGAIEIGSSSGGGSADVKALRTVVLSGSVVSAGGVGSQPAFTSLTACSLRLQSGAVIDNPGAGSLNSLTGYESMFVDIGASVISGGNNSLYYSGASPVVEGVVLPAALAVAVPPVGVCDTCSDGFPGPAESCDDGNLIAGDGCDPACQDEGCTVQTPGYPAAALCDDGNPCTADRCDTLLHACQHADPCDDGIGCTVDFCVVAACVNTVSDQACDDGNPCSDDTCSPLLDCSYLANTLACDDADECTSGDSCSLGICSGVAIPFCQECGDGIVDLGEFCDNGFAANSDILADACRTDCMLPSCGDAVTDSGEDCDDGNTDDSDDCLSTCVSASCGDGIVQAGVEQCDSDGLNNDIQPDACRTDCSLPTCGDAVTDSGEACDDGNADNLDACRNDCSLPTCGDAMLDPGEACDDGRLNSDSQPDACRTDCMLPSCGDAVTDSGEACDDANQDDSDACMSTCVLASCGDGVLQRGVEQCDDANPDNTDDCLSNCVSASCGDGLVQAGVEQCDDANQDDSDACLSSCVSASCGDGLVQAGVEQCDDGNTDDSDACLSTCVSASCGDGFAGPGEQCDFGMLNSDVLSDHCRSNCTLPACGDGVADGFFGEQCDDGNTNDSDTCLSTCVSASCGDGIVQAGVEACDDANEDESDACLSTCVSASCGDGILQAGVEICDDGNLVNSDGCSNACLFTRICGDGTNDRLLTASDALMLLQRAVGQNLVCPDYVCDVDGSGAITASDALMILRRAVGTEVPLNCGPVTSVMFRIESGVPMVELELLVEFDATVGDFVEEAGGLLCRATDGAVSIFATRLSRQALRIELFSPGAVVVSPSNTVRCEFTAAVSELRESDFDLTVTGASDANSVGVVTLPAVRAIPW